MDVAILYRAYAPMVRRQAARILGDADLAHDVADEVLAQYVQRHSRLPARDIGRHLIRMATAHARRRSLMLALPPPTQTAGRACPPPWRLSDCARSSTQEAHAMQVEMHLRQCNTCHADVHRERAELAAMAYERVPWLVLHAEPEPQRTALGRLLLSLVPLALFLALLLPVLRVDATSAADVSATVVGLTATQWRAGAVVARDVPLERLTDVRVGDVVTLAVQDVQGWVQLHSLTGGAWNTVYHGEVPPHGQLPGRWVANGRARTRLTLRQCESGGQRSCGERAYLL